MNVEGECTDSTIASCAISDDRNLVTTSDNYINFKIHIGKSVYKCGPTPAFML